MSKVSKTSLAKVSQALASMNDSYWNEVVECCGAFNKQTTQLLADFSTTYTSLSVVHVGILEAKYNGYKGLVECTDETARAQIAEENKAQICDLSHEKTKHIATLSTLLRELQTVIDSTLIMGDLSKHSGVARAKGK